MRDHGLFQAICRVNRLDGDDKDYGYIVDYRDLFNSLETAITDYTSGALDGYEKKDIEGLLTDRIEKAREDLDEALEKIRAICEPVAPPQGHAAVPAVLLRRRAGQRRAAEGQRAEARRAVQGRRRRRRAPTRNLANEMEAAGYTAAEAAAIKTEIAHYAAVRDEVKLGAGENIDFKQYEAGMRFLLDTYIQADASEIVADFEDAGLDRSSSSRWAPAPSTSCPKGIKKDPEAVAETIANNMRKVIIDERATEPEVLRQDVRAARRPHRAAAARGARLQGSTWSS